MVKKQRTILNFFLRPNENNLRRFSLWSDFVIVSVILLIIILILKFYWSDFKPLFNKVSSIVYNTDVGDIKKKIITTIESEFSDVEIGMNKKMDKIGSDFEKSVNTGMIGINENIDQHFQAIRQQ